MRDYKADRAEPPRKIVGVRELKTHAARIVRHVREAHASYVVTHRGRAVGVILPLEPDKNVSGAEEASAAWNAFLRAGKRLERRFRRGVSGVSLLSAARR